MGNDIKQNRELVKVSAGFLLEPWLSRLPIETIMQPLLSHLGQFPTPSSQVNKF